MARLRLLLCMLVSWLATPTTAATGLHRPLPNSGLLRRDERPGQNLTQYLPPPSRDPWYAPPEGWEEAQPGDVLRTRAHAYPTINIRHCNDTFQVLYRTSDSHDQASWSVATVFLPAMPASCTAAAAAETETEETKDDCPHAIVAYAVPSDSVDPDAAPSYLMQSREPYGEIRDMLARGWWVLVPDFEGPQASFCAGVQAGHATLDAARAVLKVAGRFGLRTDRAKLGLWGYSGGAHATGFAAELAGAYAPDLAIAAAVVGGASPNLTTVDDRMNRRDTAGLVVASILGVTVQQPDARSFIVSRLRTTGPFNATGFFRVTNMTGSDALDAFSGQDVFDYFQNGRDDVWSPIMQHVVDQDAVLGRHGVPNMPAFYYKAVHDEMSPVQETEDIVDRFCQQGANILFHRNDLGGHNDELWSGRPRAMEYLAAKLEGHGNITIPESGCSTVNVSVPLDPLYLLPDWWWTEGPGMGLGPTS